MNGMSPESANRAPALSAEDRRASLIAATLPLLLDRGPGVTTRQIADAAGVAEGTIFRVFDTKDELIEAALLHGVDLEPFVAELDRIDPDQELRSLLIDVVERFQVRFTEVFRLMAAVGDHGFPEGAGNQNPEMRAKVDARIQALIAPHAAELRFPPDEVKRLLRLLTLSGTHPHMNEGRTLSPHTIVDVVLDGTRSAPRHESEQEARHEPDRNRDTNRNTNRNKESTTDAW